MLEKLLISSSWLFWPSNPSSNTSDKGDEGNDDVEFNIIEYIRKIQNEQDGVLLPKEYIINHVLPVIGITFVLLSLFYTLSFKYIHLMFPHIVARDKEDDAKHEQEQQDYDKIHGKDNKRKKVKKDDLRRKTAYQLTNLCMNLILGLVGLYYEYKLIFPRRYSDKYLSVQETIVGLEDEGIYILACLQLGYQFWAIPVGIFVVQESTQMLVHHFSVIAAATMTATFINGFRHWSAFLFGIIEISSVPLAVVNTFKDNPSWLIKYPIRYNIIRLVFALFFLLIRVYMCVPRMLIFLYHAFIVAYTSPYLWHQIYMYFVFILVAFLVFLQVYWGKLIFFNLVKNLGKLALDTIRNGIGSNSSNNKKEY